MRKMTTKFAAIISAWITRQCVILPFPSVKDIMDKYYEMFRDKNRGNKSDFFNRPEDVQDSDADG